MCKYIFRLLEKEPEDKIVLTLLGFTDIVNSLFNATGNQINSLIYETNSSIAIANMLYFASINEFIDILCINRENS